MESVGPERGIWEAVGLVVVKTGWGVVGLFGEMSWEGDQGSKSGSGVSGRIFGELVVWGERILKGKTVS